MDLKRARVIGWIVEIQSQTRIARGLEEAKSGDDIGYFFIRNRGEGVGLNGKQSIVFALSDSCQGGGSCSCMCMASYNVACLVDGDESTVSGVLG